MTERKIDLSNLESEIPRSLGVSSMKKIKEQFNQEHHTNMKSISQIAKFLGKKQHDVLEVQYNLALKYNKNLKQKKIYKKEGSNFLQSVGEASIIPIYQERKYPRVSIAKLGKFVEHWYKKNIKPNKFLKINSHFEITLKSQIADVKNTFKFTHIHHFENWYKKVLTQTYVLSSDSWGNTDMPTNEEFKDLFRNSLVEKIKFISGGCNKHATGDKEIKTSFYTFKLHNPQTMNNNCFFKCVEYILGEKINITTLRKEFNIPTNEEITLDNAYKILTHLKMNVLIIDEFCNEELDEEQKYILLKKNHYNAIESWTSNLRKDSKTKRGLMTFDFETRKTEEFHLIKASNTKSYILKDSLCCVYYRPYKKENCIEKVIITNDDKTSARQFLDFLNAEAGQNRSYNVIAHNGGKFDFYFLISCMTGKEIIDADIQMRGTCIISLNYRGNLFKDSCCFLTNSLENLSKSFKIEHGKIVDFQLHGEKISSSQLCFYKPYTTFNQFLNFQTTDTDFWGLYEKYCLYDCISLFEIWEKFTICVNGLIEKISPYLLAKCPLMSSTTIGSHSKKILVEINKYDGKINYDRKQIQIFTGISWEQEVREGKEITEKQMFHINKGTALGKTLEKTHMKWKEIKDMKKYNFLCNFKRGGISHCHQAGKHLSGITGVDIASQYPASLIYSKCPTGESRWINDYQEKVHGFYHLKNLVFDTEYDLKPIATLNENKVLNWSTHTINEIYIDSYMLKYVIQFYGLKTFDVVEGLVSNKEVDSNKLFGKYINTFYEEKKLQDKYKTSKDEDEKKLYNASLRETIKLYLNSLTGKLVENPSIHFTMKPQEESLQVLNGVGMEKTFNEDKINDWLVTGIMVYSYSKRLLFEYIRCLPNGSKDVIHIETDGIYFSTQHLPQFEENLKNYEGDYPCKFGEDLGNLKIEKSTPVGQVSYFLGKKFYNITLNNDYINGNRDKNDENNYKIKGIPQTTIDDYGKKVFLVDTPLYEDIYKGKVTTRSFQTLRKALFTESTHISSHVLTRTIRPNQSYKFYYSIHPVAKLIKK